MNDGPSRPDGLDFQRSGGLFNPAFSSKTNATFPSGWIATAC